MLNVVIISKFGNSPSEDSEEAVEMLEDGGMRNKVDRDTDGDAVPSQSMQKFTS